MTGAAGESAAAESAAAESAAAESAAAESAAGAKISWDATGLAGKRAHVLVEVPTDEIDNPADLPPGTETVVIVSDEPTPHHTLFVHPEGDKEQLALVAYDQLSLLEE
jgi:hypothetical protein